MGFVMMFVFWLIGLVLFVLVLRWLFTMNRTGASTAKEVLDKRFAKGEIDEEEYRKRRSLLDDE